MSRPLPTGTYREYFALEIPDNLQHDSYLNLPLDEMMLHIQKAVENGHPVCWEDDISEEGFIHAKDNYPWCSFRGKSTMGVRGDAIVQFDWSVGKIMETLDKLGNGATILSKLMP